MPTYFVLILYFRLIIRIFFLSLFLSFFLLLSPFRLLTPSCIFLLCKFKGITSQFIINTSDLYHSYPPTQLYIYFFIWKTGESADIHVTEQVIKVLPRIKWIKYIKRIFWCNTKPNKYVQYLYDSHSAHWIYSKDKLLLTRDSVLANN